MKRKKTSRLAALAMALLTAGMAFLTAAMPAMAVGPGRITISPNGQPLEPADRFEAYQIFSGSVGKKEGELDSLEWGSGVDHERLIAAMKSSDILLSDGYNRFGSVFGLAYTDWQNEHVNELEEAEFVAQWLSQNVSRADIADDFARLVADCRTDAKSTSALWEGNWVIDGLPAGYYLVVDTYTTHGDTNKGNGDSTVSSYILDVLGDVQVELKATIPAVEKKVEGQDGWLAETVETVNFTLAGTLAGNISEYDTYFYRFTDTVSRGLTVDADSVNVRLFYTEAQNGNYLNSSDGPGLSFTKGTEYYVQTSTTAAGGTVLTVTFDDLKEAVRKRTDASFFTDLKKVQDIRIVVFYTAHLNENAAVGSDGNPNHVVLEYSNDPYGEGTGESVPDEVKTYTLALKIQKNDEKGEPMEDVRFKLKKKVSDEPVPDGKWQYAVLKFIPLESSFDAGTGADSTRGPYWVITGWVDSLAEATEFVTDTTGAFSIHGLELGSYTLVETATKEGYELMQALPFTIGVMDGAPDDDGIKTDGSLSDWLSLVVDETREDVEAADGVFSVNQAQLTLRNFPSPILPHTGGTGAAVVYTVSGIVILAGVCVVLFTVRGKKKKAD